MPLSPPMTIVALMNSMIGGTILILPLLVLSAGIIPTIISLFVMGLVNELSCRICIHHLRGDADLNTTLARHSNGRKSFGNVYNLLVFPGNLAICMVYFQLICIQWELIMNSMSKAIPLINAVAIFLLILVLKYFNFGTKLLGYGILSIASYLLFLCWVFQSRPVGDAEPIPVWTWNFNEIFNALSTAFSIQGIFVPVIRKCNQQSKYNNMILWSFILGGCVYTFIGFVGAFGIANRIPYVPHAQTIEEYFSNQDWPVMVIAVIYLVHLYTALPEYLVIGVSRLLNVFEIKQEEKSRFFRWQELLTISIALLLCLLTSLFDIKLSLLLAINGSIVAFSISYLLPAYLHIRCYYFPHEVKSNIELVEIEMKNTGATGDPIQTNSANQKQSGVKRRSEVMTENHESETVASFESEEKQCKKTQNQCERKVWMGVNLGLVVFGFLLLVYTLYTLGKQQ